MAQIQESINKILSTAALGAGLYAHTPGAKAKGAEKEIDKLTKKIKKAEPDEKEKLRQQQRTLVETAADKYAGTAAGTRIAQKLPVKTPATPEEILEEKVQQEVERLEVKEKANERFWSKRYNDENRNKANETSGKSLEDALLEQDIKGQNVKRLIELYNLTQGGID